MIGQDTEFFAFNTKKGRVVPAHTIGISKKKAEVSYAGSYFRDGYAIEFNSHPSVCRAALWENIASTMVGLKRFLPKDIILITDPSANIDLEELQTAPADLKVLGCNPTLDAYGECEKVIDVDPMKLGFRTTGAHLHHSFGSGEVKSLEHMGMMAKYCDLLIGLPFTIIYGDDKEFLRRTLYGQAGEFRKQQYKSTYYPSTTIQGFEYRVLSSRLYNHPAIFGLFSGIFKYFCEKVAPWEPSWNKALDKPLQRAINTGVGAIEILEEFSKTMKKYQTELFSNTGMSGLGYIPKDWAAAIIKLKDMRQTNDILSRFQLWEGQSQAHYGWSEYNDGVARSSTVGHVQLIPEKPWLL